MESERSIVYICAPYGDATDDRIKENIQKAETLGRVARDKGFAPIVVHSNVAMLFGDDRDPELRTIGLECNLAVAAAVADSGGSLWAVFRDDHSLSEGCSMEVVEFTNRLMRIATDQCLTKVETELLIEERILSGTWAEWISRSVI